MKYQDSTGRYFGSKSTSKTNGPAFLGWKFENCYDLAIDEINLKVDSNSSADPKFIKWTIETNAYHGVLEDKKNNIIKLEAPENDSFFEKLITKVISSEKSENFHEFIALKLEIDPCQVENIQPQIEIEINFKPDCENLEAVKKMKWLPGRVIDAKTSTENERSCLDRIFKKKSKDLPKFHFIIAIDETAQFSKGQNGSIQPKLRAAVNDLIKQLLKNVNKRELQSFGLVVVRFGGSNAQIDDPNRSFEENAGPFRTQYDHQGKSVYEFAPFPDAKVSIENFENYTKSLFRSRVLIRSPQKSSKTAFSSDKKIAARYNNVRVSEQQTQDT